MPTTPGGWPDEWDDAARALVAEVLAEPVPELERGADNGPMPQFRFRGEPTVYGLRAGDTLETVRPYALDSRRRERVRVLARAHGWPEPVVELAWELLPYGSVPFRWGWDAARAVARGRTTPEELEERARRAQRRFLTG